MVCGAVAGSGAGGLRRRVPVDGPLDLRLTLSPLRHGAADPTIRLGTGRAQRAFATPDGDAALDLVHDGDAVDATAWGPGAGWALGSVPGLVGADDDGTFDAALDVARSPRLAEVARRRRGLRLTATGLILDSLVPAVIEQRVTGREAFTAWRDLVHFHGRRAPGPAGLWVAPEPRSLLDLPSWHWQRLGVDPARRRAVRAAASVAARLEEAAAMTTAAAVARLRAVPGIGAWTAAETLQRARGEPDLVSAGDYHLPHVVVHFLTGRPRGTDEQMLELLEPWTGQRQRVVRLIESSGVGAPRFGPRYAPLDIAAL